jgi:hypothetical protein
MCARGIIAFDLPFLVHDLEHLQCRGVTAWLNLVQGFMHITHGAWSPVPKDTQDTQLGSRGLGHLHFLIIHRRFAPRGICLQLPLVIIAQFAGAHVK